MSSSDLSKAAAVLNSLAQHRGPLSMSQLADRAHLRPVALRKLLGVLSQYGWVQVWNDQVQLGPVVQDWGLTSLSLDYLPERAASYLEALHARTGFGVALSSYMAPNITLIKKVGLTSDPNAPQVGMPHPAHLLATGRSVLATFSPRYLEAYVQQYLSDKSIDWVQTHVIQPVEDTRARGFGMTKADRFKMVDAVCAPIFAANGEAIGAINLWHPTRDVTDTVPDEMLACVPSLKHCAEQISTALGATGLAA